MMRSTLRSEATALDLVVCPECDAVAEVEWRAVADSTDGPVEHAKIRCLRGHWFLMPLGLRGAGEWRVRTGDYRIVYEIHDDEVLVLLLASQTRAYGAPPCRPW